MAEIVRTTLPQNTELAEITFRIRPDSHINIKLIQTNGQTKEINIPGVEATTVFRALNKANLSTKSLVRRMYEYLISNGHIEGIIEGAPD